MSCVNMKIHYVICFLKIHCKEQVFGLSILLFSKSIPVQIFFACFDSELRVLNVHDYVHTGYSYFGYISDLSS